MKNWIIGVVVLLLAVAGYFYLTSREPADTGAAPPQSPPVVVSRAEPQPEPASRPARPEPAVPPGPGLEPVTPPVTDAVPMPMLEDSDPLVLDTLSGLIGEPAVMRYVVNENVISRMVATTVTLGSRQVPGVVQVAQGPESSFMVSAVEQPETVIRNEEGDAIPQFVTEPENSQRYTPYVELFEATDTDELVALYRGNYSLFQEAYRQMGYPDGDFDARLLATIDELLATPEVEQPLALMKPEAYFLFTDPALEARPAGQKVLLRMGSENARRVKAKLVEIRDAL